MARTLREILDIIDEGLCDYNIGDSLATVISAVRGPDSDDYGLKTITTAPIRRAAFPKLAERYDNSPGGSTPPGWLMTKTVYQRPIVISGVPQHFVNHANDAAKVLGIL